ncbi:Terminase small subunit, partial [uncultured Caudovirales phage]
RLDIDWVNAERARAEAEAARQREENERLAREQRAADLAKAEAEAEALEAIAADLSEREQIFVEQFVATNDSIKAAQRAGYKNPEATAVRLLGTKKIVAALEAHRAALVLRLQADAVSQQPLDVAPVVVETAVASVAGTSLRTYYSCGDVDVLALAKAVVAGKVSPLALQPNTVFLNKQASALKELFPSAFPGCQLAKKQGISG